MKNKRWKIIAGITGGIITFCCACIAITGVMDKLGLLPTLTPTLQSSSTSTLPPQPSSTITPISSPTIAQTSTPSNTPVSIFNLIPTATQTTIPTQTSIPTVVIPSPIVIIPTQQPPSSGGSGSYDNNGDGKVTCKDFQTQAAAQQAYNSGYKNLDGNDNDGKACESLP